ncbi:hypothetical protein [Longimycelium tulufanense]|uniref:hypothetical protein n=1 Tax=Longimycelium tulufanense TaxID=907463 RepID=UPI00166CC344|nr:hypothetical protein [Longimycelium tulufanense]
MAEPYQLDSSAFEDFLCLREHGWNVQVTAWQARHKPGHTVAVLIWKKPEPHTSRA